ncbi:transglutaminase-like cysteine peptidase [Halomonas dongshanensis]|uniref:Transglutaminase-like cysteine peptidase n=1 Tax=Halomonas dongshanensis TaxID=2890835 RepID=A0ABT2EBR9_9GAMM|nr:transglutaminase-like cysteine peptidase [Halomonas dongshanensis]MCS2609027.1 transglutaminase-like cysteine peptidase [Halomonas dongshanensis]
MSVRFVSRPLDASRRRFLAGLGGVAAALALGLPTPPAQAFDPDRLRQSMQRLYGQGGLRVLEEWFALLERLRGEEISVQLREVNDFFNRRVRWVDDINNWGSEDHWATPLETMGQGQGDCEDYSIAKYVTLKQLGVPGERLRMIYVRARIGRSQITQAHMVLGYYSTPDAEPLVLDNILPSITPASQRSDLDPLFSFNSDGLWAGGSTQSRADPLARLSRWRGVIERMQSQGFT